MALVGEMKYLTIGENTYSISAGAKTFIVTLTESNGVYTSDKTAEEIYTAFNAGDTVLLDCGSYVLLSSVYREDNYYQANFYKSEASTGSFNLYEYMIVTNNGVTSVESNYYNTPVNNGSLIIQKNGSTVGTFSANSSSNITANITVPTKVSDLTNDSGYITTYTETDPTVPAWAKQSTKPSYVAAEVGALPDTTQIPSKTSDLVNDSGFITGYTETDPTVPSWAKQSTKPSYTANEVGALPASTVIPSKTSDLTNDSGYITTETDPTVPTWAKAASKPTYTASEVGALPDTTIIPSATSDLNNDSGFITANDIPEEVEIVEYNTTTYNDILSLYNAGKTIYCHVDYDTTYSDFYLALVDYTVAQSRFIFSAITLAQDGVSPAAHLCTCSYANGWSYEFIYLPIDVPSKTSDLTNDSGFITVNDVPEEVAFAIYGQTTYTDIYAFATANKYVVVVDNDKLVPCTISLVGSTAVCSHFENGSEIIYVVTSEGWTSTSISYATTASLATVATSGSYNDLSNRPAVSDVQIVRWSEENN